LELCRGILFFGKKDTFVSVFTTTEYELGKNQSLNNYEQCPVKIGYNWNIEDEIINKAYGDDYIHEYEII
jgi:hypothetical protein